MNVRAILVVVHAADYRQETDTVRKAFSLRNKVDNILSEAVHAHRKPETKDVLNFLTNLRVIHIEVGLLLGKKMQIVLSAYRIVLPRLSFKDGVPVIGLVTPDVIILIRVVITALTALDEPRMLIRCVIYNKVHNDLHAQLVCLIKHLLKLLKVTVVRMNVAVVRNIIAKVCVGRRVQRIKPYSRNPKAL